MHFITLITLLLPVVNAVHYYGDGLNNDIVAKMEDYAIEIQSQGYRLSSVLVSYNINHTETARFINDTSSHDTPIGRLFESGYGNNNKDIDKRDSFATTCQSDNIILSDTVRFQICTGIAGAAAGGIAYITIIVDGLRCTGGGRQLNCHGKYGFLGGASGTIAVNEINQYCPSLLDKVNTKCNNKGGESQDKDNGDSLSVTYAQGDGNCRDTVGSCRVVNN